MVDRLIALSFVYAGVFSVPAFAQSTLPELSGLSSTVQKNIKAACSTEYYGGPAAYRTCLQKQVRGHRRVGPVDLSGLSSTVQKNIKAACSTEYYGGPAAHRACLRKQALSIGYNPDVKRQPPIFNKGQPKSNSIPTLRSQPRTQPNVDVMRAQAGCDCRFCGRSHV